MQNISPAENSNSDHAYWTFITGTRPFQGLEMFLESVKNNFSSITNHPCGSFSDTNDLICRNSFSDIALIMSYSLLEGFFSAEYDFYVKNNRPKYLLNVIEATAKKHNLVISDWSSKKEKINIVRKLRNAATHNNGLMSKIIDKTTCEKIFGEDIFHNKNYPQLSFEGSLSLIRDFKNIAEEYAEHVFNLTSHSIE